MRYAYNFAVRGHRTMAIAPMYDDYEGAFYQCTKAFELFGASHEACADKTRQKKKRNQNELISIQIIYRIESKDVSVP